MLTSDHLAVVEISSLSILCSLFLFFFNFFSPALGGHRTVLFGRMSQCAAQTTCQEWGVVLHLLEGRVPTYVVWNFSIRDICLYWTQGSHFTLWVMIQYYQFIVLLILFQLWQSGPLPVGPCVPLTDPITVGFVYFFTEHIVTFWHCKMSQAHLVCVLPQP